MRFAKRAGTGVLLGLMLAFGAGAVTAQETIGKIIGTIDGEAFEWRTLGADGSGDDYNTSLGFFGNMPHVSLMGFPPDQVTMRGSVNVTFTLMPNSLETLDQEVIYAPEGMSRMWVSIDGENLIAVEHFDATSPLGEVSGRFSGRLCLKESLLSEPDPDRCQAIEGSFNSRLPHSEF